MINKSIGIFDSGLGGLTVVRRLRKLLPRENIIYFGDTGRVPYGTRSPDTIARYAREDADFLLSRGVKLIIAACGTVSSTVPDLCDYVNLPYLGVVSPAAAAAAAATKNGNIGVIGTSATVRSGAFPREIKSLNPGAKVFQTACPVLVPLVEAGWIAPGDEITTLAAGRYLSELQQHNIDTLILGCTHYPIISEIIGNIIGEGVKLIDTGLEAALYVEKLLTEKNLLNTSGDGRTEYFVSDETEGFSKTASLFLGSEIGLHVNKIEI